MKCSDSLFISGNTYGTWIGIKRRLNAFLSRVRNPQRSLTSPWTTSGPFHDINTRLCPIIFNSNTNELHVNTSCYWVLDLICVNDIISRARHLGMFLVIFFCFGYLLVFKQKQRWIAPASSLLIFYFRTCKIYFQMCCTLSWMPLDSWQLFPTSWWQSLFSQLEFWLTMQELKEEWQQHL